MIPPVLPTYARAPIAFERGEGSASITADGQELSRFRRRRGGHQLRPRASASGRGADRAGPEDLAHVQPLPDAGTGEAGAAASPKRPSPTRCSSPTRAPRRWSAPSRWRASIMRITVIPSASGIITFEGAFHGRTLATIAAGGQAKYLEGFGPKVEGFDQVPFGDHDALKAAIGPETAGILIEPVQGEGGIRPVPPQCLRGLARALRRTRHPADLRRGAVRHRPHRQALRP